MLKSGHFFLLLIVIILSGCKEDEIDFPVLLLEGIGVSGGEVVATGKFENISAEEIEEFGLLWSENVIPNFENSLLESYPKEAFTGSITLLIETIKASTKYHCRLYAKTSSNTHYSNTQVFTSPSKDALKQSRFAPEITNVIPPAAHFGDTIKIYGSNFGIQNIANKVFLNEDSARIIHRSDTTITAVVPLFSKENAYFKSGSINFEVYKYGAASESYSGFSIKPPEITEITHPSSILANNTLTLTGKGFHPTETHFFFDNQTLDFTYYNGYYFVQMLPTFESLSGTFSVSVKPHTLEIEDYEILAPEILNDFSEVELGVSQTYTLKGRNLKNSALSFSVNDRRVPNSYSSATDTTISFQIHRLCDDEITLKFEFYNGIELVNNKIIATIPRSKMKLTNHSVTLNNYYNARVNLTGQYLNNQDWSLTIQGKPAEVYPLMSSDGSFEFSLSMPSGLVAEQPVDLRLISCGDLILIESLFDFPGPVIDGDPDIYSSFDDFTLNGQNLAGPGGRAYINGELVATALPNFNLHSFKLPYLPDGVHSLTYEVNGSMSNEITLEIQNKWHKIASLNDHVPDDVVGNGYPIGFLHGDKLYLGSPSEDDHSFFEIDLISGNITRLNDAPVATGISEANVTHGYVFYQRELYGFDFQSQTWFDLPEIPISLTNDEFPNLGQWDITKHAGMLSGDKFIFVTGIQPTYYFDLNTNTWHKLPDEPKHFINDPLFNITYTGESQYYISNYGVFRFMPDLLSFTAPSIIRYNPPILGNLHSSRQGFYHQEEIYIYSNDYLNSLNVRTTEEKWIMGPKVVRYPKLIHSGNDVIVIIGLDIWKYNLENQ